MKTTLSILALLCLLLGTVKAQPDWQDISALPNRDMGGMSRIVAADGSLWATFCTNYAHNCLDWSFRPFYSSDGGTSWERRDNGLPDEFIVLSIEVNPVDPNLMLTTGKGWSNHEVGPFISHDRGLNWAPTIRNVAVCSFGYAQSGWFSDGRHAWCHIMQPVDRCPPTWSVIGLSADSGQTWTLQDTTFCRVWMEVYAHPRIPNIALEGEWGPVIRHTTNYGNTWELCSNPYEWQTIWFGGVGESPNIIYGTAHVWKHIPELLALPVPMISNDTGVTWQILHPADTAYWTDQRGGIQKLLKDPLQAGHLFGTSYDTLYETMDNCEHWTVIRAGFREHYMNLIAYDPWHDRIYFGTASREIGQDTTYMGLFRWSREQATEPIGNNLQPTEFSLGIYPNPFNTTATLSYSLPKPGNTSIRVFDITGRIVKTVHEGPQTAGEHSVMMNGSGLASGIYFVRLDAGSSSQTKKTVLLK